MSENKTKYTRHAQEFKHVFGVELRDYWDIKTGFDIIKFDREVIKPADDVSMKAAVLAKYGQDAVKLIENLI